MSPSLCATLASSLSSWSSIFGLSLTYGEPLPHEILDLRAHEVVPVASPDLFRLPLDARNRGIVGLAVQHHDRPPHQTEIDRDEDADDPVEYAPVRSVYRYHLRPPSASR